MALVSFSKVTSVYGLNIVNFSLCKLMIKRNSPDLGQTKDFRFMPLLNSDNTKTDRNKIKVPFHFCGG